MIVQQYYSRTKSENAETEIQLTLCLSRIERSTVEPTENVVTTCRLRERNFEKSPLADFGCDARSFAGDREAAVWVGLCAVARSWGIGWRPGAAGVEIETYFQPN